VNVEFEWFNFDPEIDFHGTKTLLRQLFDVDAPLFDISGLADLILSQPTIGSTVKVEGKATDAYAFLTALNTFQHREHKALAGVTKYIAERAQTNPSLEKIPSLLSGDAHIGLVFSERLINMPSEIAPPMYSMLLDEVEAAVEDKEPYEFSHYLVVSKTYHEVESTLEMEGERKKKKAKEEAPLFYFHPEDEVLREHALVHGSFAYANDKETVADSKRAFHEMGVQAQGYLLLIEAGKFAGAIQAITEYLGQK